MQITAKVSLDENQELVDIFMKKYVPHIIQMFFHASVSKKKLSVFDEEFNINSYKAISYALKHLLVTKVRGNTYTIKFNESLKYDDKPIIYYINVVTYGNREVKGYTVLLDIFNSISHNIYYLYNAWLMGMSL